MVVRSSVLLGDGDGVRPHLGSSVPRRDTGLSSCHRSALGRLGPVPVRRGRIGRDSANNVPTYLCKTCGKRYAGRSGFHNRRADPEEIALTLDLYFRGMSLRKIADRFAQVYPLRLNASTVYR